MTKTFSGKKTAKKATTTKAAGKKTKPVQSKKKWKSGPLLSLEKPPNYTYDELTNPIEKRAARTRLYDFVVDPDTQSCSDEYYHVMNKEKVKFKANKKDFECIGAYHTIEDVTQTEMMKRLLDATGFFFIRFYKLYGGLRDMYATQHGAPMGDTMYLRDLQLDNTERRSCSMRRVAVFVQHGVLYRLNKAAWRNLIRAFK